MASTTISLSFSILLSMFSIPFLSVNVEDGQPLHEPWSTTLTCLESGLYESKSMLPPSAWTAGFTYSSKIFTIVAKIVLHPKTSFIYTLINKIDK